MTENTKETSQIHAGHRQRLREKLLKAQGDALYAHELLELLTCYAIPRRDTNELAHKILHHFDGNFSAVFEADFSELRKIPGVGEHTATLIVLVNRIRKEMEQERSNKITRLTTAEKAAEYAKGLFYGNQTEAFYAIFLTRGGKVIAKEKICNGSVSEIAIEPRKTVEAALRFQATKEVIFVHNHPSGNLSPSGADIDATRLLTRALNTVDVRVKDHIIVLDDEYYSFAEHGLLI